MCLLIINLEIISDGVSHKYFSLYYAVNFFLNHTKLFTLRKAQNYFMQKYKVINIQIKKQFWNLELCLGHFKTHL